MRSLPARLFIVMILALVWASLDLVPARGQTQSKKFALLVGVNEYEHGQLKALRYAENDVVELRDLLQQHGYTVTLLCDSEGKKDESRAPNRANIEKHLKQLLKGRRKADTVLVAFAGHGLQFQDKKDAFFCPSDAVASGKKTETLISLGKVYQDLDNSLAGVKVLLVDACRDEPDAVRGIRGVNGDSSPPVPHGVAAFFSCKSGEVAYEHRELKHGVFFHFVLKGLRGEAKNNKGVVTFNSLVEYVQEEVTSEVPRLFGEGAHQSPNQKADLVLSPVLVTLKDARLAAEYQQLTLKDARLAAEYQQYLKTLFAKDSAKEFLKEHVADRLSAWRDAAEQGMPTAQLFYAGCFLDGVGVSRDEKEAVRWYRKAADQGNVAAQNNLGYCYQNGFGVAKDAAEAVRWYRKAADQGSAAAQNNLGYCYQHGIGVVKYAAEAVRWYLKAADQGSAAALNNLGYCYEHGIGVIKDAFEAVNCYRRSAQGGNEYAKKALQRLGQ